MFTASILGLPTQFFSDLLATLLFGLVALLLVVVGYKVFDIALRKLDFDDELKKNNTSMAIVIAALIIGLCYVMGQVVTAIVAG